MLIKYKKSINNNSIKINNHKCTNIVIEITAVCNLKSLRSVQCNQFSELILFQTKTKHKKF